MWAPQTVTDILKIERVQRRTTKFILSLQYSTDTPYSARPQTISIIPVCYWHEYLDLVCLYKCILSNDSNVSVRTPILLNVPKCKRVSYQNSFCARARSVWNIPPGYIRDTSRSLDYLKNCLLRYYFNLLEHIYNPDNPRALKSVCIKCHSTWPLESISVKLCC